MTAYSFTEIKNHQQVRHSDPDGVYYRPIPGYGFQVICIGGVPAPPATIARNLSAVVGVPLAVMHVGALTRMVDGTHEQDQDILDRGFFDMHLRVR